METANLEHFEKNPIIMYFISFVLGCGLDALIIIIIIPSLMETIQIKYLFSSSCYSTVCLSMCHLVKQLRH